MYLSSYRAKQMFDFSYLSWFSAVLSAVHLTLCNILNLIDGKLEVSMKKAAKYDNKNDL